MSEFSIIEKYFANITEIRSDVKLGIGDDAAILSIPKNSQLAVSVDTLISGTHFPAFTSAYDIGWKSLAVNLSDMAAMAARPCWATLAITLNNEDEKWLRDFADGFSDLANRYNVQLIGGDTTSGALSLTVQIIGLVENKCVTSRSRAQVGDKVYVTGYLGDAALGLQTYSKKISNAEDHLSYLRKRLNRPEPRINEAIELCEYVNAAIDISDGLLADLQHILDASNVGATIETRLLPLSTAYQQVNKADNICDYAISGGDDYELCLVIAKEKEAAFLSKIKQIPLLVTKIGEITLDNKLSLFNNGEVYDSQVKGYNHFS